MLEVCRIVTRYSETRTLNLKWSNDIFRIGWNHWKKFSKLNGLNKMATCSKSIASEYCRTDPMSNSRWRMCVESDPETSTRTWILHEFFRAHRFKILHTSSEYDRILFIWIHRGMKITFVSTIFFWNSITFNN